LRGGTLWFFARILGVLLALAFMIVNAIWYESQQCLGPPEAERPAV
jgi:cyd operon protein YbgT